MADEELGDAARSREPRSNSPRRDDRGRRPSARGDGTSRDRKPGSPSAKRDGAKPYQKRDGDKPHPRRDGDKPYQRRDGAKPHQKRDGEKPYQRREGEKPYQRREGDKPHQRRAGDRAGGPRGARPTRGGAGRPDRAVPAGVERPDRPRHDEPAIPEDVTGRDLHPSARNELKTLSKENAEEVARHLAMASRLIEEDPAQAHRHALAAARRAGRIAVVRETVAITAYATGDFALALRELRTYRRISGRDDQIAMMVDSERGVGRPDRALEVGRSVDRAALPTAARVELAITMSGARLDLDQPDRALTELDIPELDPDRAFDWSPALFAARATVLEELGRVDEAAEWRRRADIAAEALEEASGARDLETIVVEEIGEDDDVVGAGGAPPATDEIEDAADRDATPTVDDEVAEILRDAGVDEDED